MVHATHLERTLYRLSAQYATLGLALKALGPRTGVVYEVGLGKGRSFDHLRRALPQCEIFGFDRRQTSVPDCTPEGDRLVLGDVAQTLPQMAERHRGQVVLAHVDLGGAGDKATASTLSEHLPALLAPGAVVASDVALALAGAREVDVPPPAAAGGFHLYVAAGEPA